MNENIPPFQPKYSVPDLSPIKKGFMYYVNRIFSILTPKELTRGVKISTTIHLSILLFAIIGPLIIPHHYRNFTPTVHTVQLINMPGHITQSDTQALKPEITAPVKPKQEIQKPKAEKKPVIQKPVEKPIQQKPKMTVPEKKRAKPEKKEKIPTLKERLAQRLKEADSKKSKMPQKEWEETDAVTRPKDNSTELEGVIFSGSLGNSGTLGIASSSDFPFQWYLELIHGKISSCWTDPQMALDKQSSAIISFTITKTGEITNIYLKSSSGTQTFDQSGIKAIELAKPFPQLPIGYTDSELIVNVEFNLTK